VSGATQSSDDSADYDPLSVDLSQYRQMYVDETEEQLDDLVETMLVLEEDPTDTVSLATAFRLLHSMKGAAGMMGFDQITVLTHHLETRFERLRSGRIQLDRITMNLTLRCIDFLRQCNEHLRENTELATPDVLLEELRELEERTEKELAAENEPDQEPDQEPALAPRDSAPRDLGPPTESKPDHQSIPDEPIETHQHLVIAFGREHTNPIQQAIELLGLLERIGTIEATRPDRDEIESAETLETFDVIILTASEPERLAEVVFVDGVDRVEVRIPREPDAQPLAMRVRPAEPKLQQPAIQVMESASENIEETSARPAVANAREPIPPQQQKAAYPKSSETMRVDIDRLDVLMSLAGELVVNRAQFVEVAKDLGSELRQSSIRSRSREFQDALRKTISKLRDLQTTSGGEWLLSIQALEAGLTSMEQQQAMLDESRRKFGRLDEAIDQLSRVSSSLQRGVLGTRMVPVAPLFNRFKRVVRDLAIDRGKQVALVIEGDQTELDKRMIDALGDPLVHLIRNSIDHGLENPDQRIAVGKPAEGTIRLSAQHRGNHIYIHIEDDGGGIDDEKIRRRLVSKKIMDQDSANELSREEAIEYIWHPGFSTAEQVTDVSGRGVGMDIVKSRISELAGAVEIESEMNVGTRFTLKLPLTLAIIGSLMVKIRDITFAIPNEDVREIVKITENDVITVQGQKTFEVRGRFIPLLTIDDLFQWNDISATDNAIETPTQDTFQPTEVVVLQTGGRSMGLRVDLAIGSEDVVIKSLADNFTSIDGLAGANILGNGSVALMLDVSALVRMSAATEKNPQGVAGR
jgi:two-component system chemotaxis sensor kinase CheA